MLINFGALDVAQRARLDADMAKAKADLDQAKSLAPSLLQRGWLTLIGASSTANAMNTDVQASQTLYDTLARKADILRLNPYATEADLIEFETGVKAGSNEALVAAASQASPGAFYEQVVAKTATDVGSVVKNPLGVPLAVWVAGALGVYFFAKGLGQR